MKPSEIHAVLDLGWEINRKQPGKNFVPCFAGDAGIGKSEIVQQWAKKRNFKFLDVRLAYLEGPDFIGLPFALKDKDGMERTIYALPETWPTDKDAPTIICFEEPNRGVQSVTNCMMQALTDKKIGKYEFPGVVMFTACINPDNAFYTVNSMDTALANRFVMYDVRFDLKEFITYAESANYHPNVISFLKSGSWTYTPPEQLQNNAATKYVSPRSFSYLSNAEHADLQKNRDLHIATSVGILGEGIGVSYNKFIFDITPVTATDIVEDKKTAYKKLTLYKNPYRGDLLNVTVDSVAEAYIAKMPKLTEKVVMEVVQMLPMDQSNNLLLKLFMDGKIGSPKEITAKYPELKEHIRLTLIRQQNMETKAPEVAPTEKEKKK